MAENFDLKNISTQPSPIEGKAASKKIDLKFSEIFLPALVILVIIFAGASTGFLLTKNNGGNGFKASSITGGKKLMGGAETVSTDEEVGIKDERVFSDTAQGKIVVNDGELVSEGSHKLLRPGGKSQTAYITSSVLDLDDFDGECVQIWGETFEGQEAGWLMDVGRVKHLDKCPDGI